MAEFVGIFNRTREHAALSFLRTLEEFMGRQGVTERAFQERWVEALSANPQVIAEGWYQPPPMGIAVLAADAANSRRISFSTLRHEEYWPSDQVIDWRDGMLYGYCSPVGRLDGLPGDFAITIYFGGSRKIRQHFLNAHKVVSSLLSKVEAQDGPLGLFRMSQEIFRTNRLENTVLSLTDSTPLDLGHTLPSLSPIDLLGNLCQDQRDVFRKGRRFLNSSSDWTFEEGMQFTIEPQLRSLDDESLPQVSFHYVLRLNSGYLEIQDDVDHILRRFHVESLCDEGRHS